MNPPFDSPVQLIRRVERKTADIVRTTQHDQLSPGKNSVQNSQSINQIMLRMEKYES